MISIQQYFSEKSKYCRVGMTVKTVFFSGQSKYSSVVMMVKTVFSQGSQSTAKLVWWSRLYILRKVKVLLCWYDGQYVVFSEKSNYCWIVKMVKTKFSHRRQDTVLLVWWSRLCSRRKIKLLLFSYAVSEKSKKCSVGMMVKSGFGQRSQSTLCWYDGKTEFSKRSQSTVVLVWWWTMFSQKSKYCSVGMMARLSFLRGVKVL